MLVVWSVKGGSGATVVAAGAGRESARRRATLLVDFGGDLPAVLGVEQPARGITDWAAAPDPPPDALARLEVPVGPRLSILALGAPAGCRVAGDRMRLLAAVLAADPRQVVLDVGTAHEAAGPLLDRADVSVLVTRLCYLAVSRAVDERTPDRVVVVREVGRALRVSDVEAAVGAPVAVTIDVDPAVARAVDAGLLRVRTPRSLRRLGALVGG